jgi:hypothetical protein
MTVGADGHSRPTGLGTRAIIIMVIVVLLLVAIAVVSASSAGIS